MRCEGVVKALKRSLHTVRPHGNRDFGICECVNPSFLKHWEGRVGNDRKRGVRTVVSSCSTRGNGVRMKCDRGEHQDRCCCLRYSLMNIAAQLNAR